VIHVLFFCARDKDVDGRDKPGHDDSSLTPLENDGVCISVPLLAYAEKISSTTFSHPRLICPSCQCVAVDLKRKSAAFLAPSCLGKRGVCAIVTKREAGCDGRGMSLDEGRCARTAKS
jgi:hypothetical protein